MKHKENFLGLSLSHHVILVAKFKNFSVRELCPLCFLNDIQLRNHQVIIKVYVEYPFALIFVLKLQIPAPPRTNAHTRTQKIWLA